MIEIKKMIVHKLNIKENNPILSESLINLENLEDKDVALSFFSKHISNTRVQAFTKSCYFREVEGNYVRDGIQEIADVIDKDSEEFDKLFIKHSRLITSDLRQKMERKSRSDGSIFMLYYTNDSKNFISILKMDPNNGVTVNNDLTITVVKDLLPNIGEKLHKAAFVKVKSEYKGKNVQLFVLDKQKSNEDGAKYFISDFLQADEKAGDSNLTPVIERALISEITNSIQDANDRFKFTSDIKKRLNSGQSFNLDEDITPIAQEYFSEGFDFSYKIEQIKLEVLKKYPDANFKIMPDPNKLRKTIFKSNDDEIRIEIKSGFEQYIEIERDKNKDFIMRIPRNKLEVKEV